MMSFFIAEIKTGNNT